MSVAAPALRSAASLTSIPAAVQPTYARLIGDWRRPLVSNAELALLNKMLKLDPSSIHGVAVALGKFDAMHIGHASLAKRARDMGALPCLLSFHGIATVLGLPHRQPLTAECDRSRILRSWAHLCGGVTPIQRSIPFIDVRHLEPEVFVELLAKELHVTGVIAGSNYRFGTISAF
jgi:FAD synthase